MVHARLVPKPIPFLPSVSLALHPNHFSLLHTAIVYYTQGLVHANPQKSPQEEGEMELAPQKNTNFGN